MLDSQTTDVARPAAVPALDDEGFLLDIGTWTPAVAEFMAAMDGIQLTDEHWFVIGILRDFYAIYGFAPAPALTVKHLQVQTDDSGWSRSRLKRLFPVGEGPSAPACQACRYAGLPKPASGYCG